MAFSKLLVASLIVFISIAGARSDGSAGDPEPSGSALRSELETLRSKISALESSIMDGTKEIKFKEDGIAKLENIIKEKSESIKLLKSEIEALQKRDALNAAKTSGKSDAQVSELEKQEELMRAQLEATSQLTELSKVHGAWLPTWILSHINPIQELAVTNWNEHAKPALIVVLQKASEKSEQAQRWAGPHLHAAKTKWIPSAKEQLVVFKNNAVPYCQKISAKSIEIYEASCSAIEPHAAKVKELMDPYVQQAKRFLKPYIDQVLIATKPHFEKVLVLLVPFKKHVVHAYGKFYKTTGKYHSQVQTNIHEQLKKHELTKPHATKELAWFMASALLAFPVVFLYRLLSAVFWLVEFSDIINCLPIPSLSFASV